MHFRFSLLVFYFLIRSNITHQNQIRQLGNSNSSKGLNEAITIAENGIDETSFKNITDVDQANADNECVIDDFGSTVACDFETWNPETLQSYLVNTSTVTYLKINVKHSPNHIRLTKQHLEGLNELKHLVIKGTCPTNYVFLVCFNPYGIESMDNDTFEETPNLTHLTLVKHPLRSTEALHKLKSLRYLNFRVLPNLTLIPSSLDNMRGTIRSIKLKHVSIDKITRNHFKDMRELSTLEVLSTTNSLFIDSEGVKNLPNLTSLWIGKKLDLSMSAPYDLAMGINAINNVPNLREVTLSNIDKTNGSAYGSCNGNFNIERLEMHISSVSIFNYCNLLLQCIKCGCNPKRHPQTILFSLSGDSRENDIERVFPPKSIMPKINVSRLIFMETFFSNPFSVLPQTPLLKEFIVEEGSSSEPIDFFPIQRLDGNPFAKLAKEVRLDKVRIRILRCGCEVLKVIKWFEETQIPNIDKSVSDILQIDCFYIDGLCRPKRNTISNPIFQDLSFLKKKLTHLCNKPKQLPTISGSNIGTCFCEELVSCPSSSSIFLPRARGEKSKSSKPIRKDIPVPRSLRKLDELLISHLQSVSLKESSKPTLDLKNIPVDSAAIKSSSPPRLSFIDRIKNVGHSNSRRTSKPSLIAI